MRRIATIHITPEQVLLNGQPLAVSETGKALLTSLYKRKIGDYLKFYKMDSLARLGFVASELLLQSIDEELFVEREDRAIVLVNKSASVAADSRYEETIQSGEDYFPSPADFVYTLPNIVTGEIAIRHHYHGETTFAVIDSKDNKTLDLLIRQALLEAVTTSVLGGWLECEDENHYEADIALYGQS